jgi:small subunit ribosomal protein S16
MQTKIRLARFGAKKKPFYRIVISSVSSSRDGRFIDILGHYDPAQGVKKAQVDQEKVALWIKRGATPTDVVKQIIKSAQE